MELTFFCLSHPIIPWKYGTALPLCVIQVVEKAVIGLLAQFKDVY